MPPYDTTLFDQSCLILSERQQGSPCSGCHQKLLRSSFIGSFGEAALRRATSVEQQSWASCTAACGAMSKLRSGPNAPPYSGSSPAPDVCGGAQRGTSLATGFLTGESSWNPPRGRQPENRLQIKGLRNHELARVASRQESRESTPRKPPGPETTQPGTH